MAWLPLTTISPILGWRTPGSRGLQLHVRAGSLSLAIWVTVALDISDALMSDCPGNAQNIIRSLSMTPLDPDQR